MTLIKAFLKKIRKNKMEKLQNKIHDLEALNCDYRSTVQMLKDRIIQKINKLYDVRNKEIHPKKLEVQTRYGKEDVIQIKKYCNMDTEIPEDFLLMEVCCKSTPDAFMLCDLSLEDLIETHREVYNIVYKLETKKDPIQDPN